jgi:hypothetical protein
MRIRVIDGLIRRSCPGVRIQKMASIERPMIGGLSSLVRNHFAAVNILFDTE